jgi:hypothetical protein
MDHGMNFGWSIVDCLFVALLHQAIAPVVITSLAVEDGLDYDLLPAICIQCPPEILLFALVAAFGTKRDIVF